MINSIDQIIENKQYPPILLMFGEEEYLIESDYERLINSIIPDRSKEFDFEVYDGEDAKLMKVVDSCLSFPFMSDKRVVVVKDFEKMIPTATSKIDKELLSFKKYMDSPQPTTLLIIKTKYKKLNGYAAAKKGNKTTNIGKILKGAGFPFDKLLQEYDWIEYPKMYESSYPALIKNKAKLAGKTIASDAIEFLIAQTNQDLRSLSNELEKVIIYVEDRKKIDLKDIAFVVGASHKYNVFELQKSIGKKDIALSLQITERMLSTESLEMLILTMITRYFIILWKLLELAGRNNNNYELATQVGVSPYFIPEYLEALGRYKPAQIENALMELTKTEELLKSSSQNNTAVMQKMVINIIDS
jgi:DNA polymerase III subunit delta